MEGRITLSMREAAAELKSRGVEMSKSELHRRMPELIERGVIEGIRAPGRKRSFWQITPEEVGRMEKYFRT